MSKVLIGIIAALILAGLFRSVSIGQCIAYLIVLAAALLPTLMWLRIGSTGIPILQVVALMYIPYYAWPIVSRPEVGAMYSDGSLLRCAFTVALFLVAALATWRMAMRTETGTHVTMVSHIDQQRIRWLMWTGLAVGILFHAAVLAGASMRLGSFFGLVRSMAISLAIVAFFLAGVARGGGLLSGRRWHAVIAAAGALIVLTWSSLFLLGGLLYLLALGFGYVIAAKRIPWRWVVAGLVVLTVLHAGKGEMRAKYWVPGTNFSDQVSLARIPSFAAEWIIDGLNGIADIGTDQSFLGRASLLQMILRVQAMTPETVPYSHGDTYALLPRVLVPRFLDAGKPASQMGMDLLNIRYGILTAGDAAVTAVGWGLIAEAFANFGFAGVMGAGLLLGLLCGMLARWSSGAGIISLPTLVAIVAMVTLINPEADSVTLCSTLFQSIASIIAAYGAFGHFSAGANLRVALRHAGPSEAPRFDLRANDR